MTKERAPQPLGWVLAYRYSNARDARFAWERTRDLLLSDDLDASTFRFELDRVTHLALLGERPLSADAERKVHAIIDQAGEPAALPEAVLEVLRARRRRFKNTGFEFMERRTPGR